MVPGLTYAPVPLAAHCYGANARRALDWRVCSMMGHPQNWGTWRWALPRWLRCARSWRIVGRNRAFGAAPWNR